MTDGISVEFQGPYTFLDVFSKDIIEKKGVYLWVIETDKGNLINYVGSTLNSFELRFAEHLGGFTSGRYYVYEKKELLTGYKNGEKPKFKWGCQKDVFLSRDNYIEFQKYIYSYLGIIKIYLAELDDDSLIKSLERYIYEELKNNKDELVCGFLDNVRAPAAKYEAAKVNFSCPPKLMGLN